MQDFDFDEIDRAVSSTLGTSGGSSGGSSKSTPAPTPDADDTRIAVSASPRETPQTPVAPRPSSGRFMDVVHPSSDMKPADRVRVAPRPEIAEPESTPGTEAETTWPDPLDFHGFNLDEDNKEQEQEEEKVVKEATTPLETPFLSDAKIEKRPLGAFSMAEPATPLLEETTEEEPAAAEDASVGAVAEEMPEPSVESREEKMPEATTVEEAPAPMEESSGVPTSITQQYKEVAPSDDNPSGAIYDTESYHAPLTHTPKKSGASVIIWILALILVGGGIGAAAYFFVLPNL